MEKMFHDVNRRPSLPLPAENTSNVKRAVGPLFSLERDGQFIARRSCTGFDFKPFCLIIVEKKGDDVVTM